jgi:hypothetical protein
MNSKMLLDNVGESIPANTPHVSHLHAFSLLIPRACHMTNFLTTGCQRLAPNMESKRGLRGG